MSAEHEASPDALSPAAAELLARVRRRAPQDAVRLLERADEALAVEALAQLSQTARRRILSAMEAPKRDALSAALGAPTLSDAKADPRTVGALAEAAPLTVTRDTQVREVTEQVRVASRTSLVTYVYVLDEQTLVGVLTMRDLLLADPEAPVSDVMLADPFFLTPDVSVESAMRAMVHRHYPVYPVCREDGHFLGVVPGYALFEEHTFELTAQPGLMVGVDEDEQVGTPWTRSLKLRHPWLQVNLITAFAAAAVVGLFEGTLERIVILAAFLPVLAGQAGNTGCQAMAVTLRGLALNEVPTSVVNGLLRKEAVLGLVNGLLTGLSAAAGMWIYASMTGTDGALTLALVVVLAMIGSCLLSGVVGVAVPLTLKKVGADPATASSIFLTTATDVVSLGLFLGLASLLLL
ncbi:magnesium transporter [uncultured Abyssibacter sp.]|uniref:magnesium transporter n=1 Tax=uncultured Abyssibacter sp. TaxID=2320202 RepID=UPI0032B1200E